jgi:predicted transcriptional regulator
MDRHEQLRRYILNNQKCSPTGGIHYAPIKLAIDFGLPVDHVGQILAEMEAEGLVTLDSNSGHIAVTVTARGAQLLSEIPTATIGLKSN